ncbi:hypothetical protein [Rhizobium sp. N324]|uniref:hypothetical protein n=1 Tax=Rhizobium sp. N324 TaxID=1703969 RepID=UPI0007E93306|nr:hypothetical protein [Rhizobium sp. N324]
MDNALVRAGEDIVLRRTVGSGANVINIDVKCRAAVRAVSADEIVGTITQRDLVVIISPTQILAAQWPGGAYAGGVTSDVDPRIPKETDFALIQGRQRQVRASKPIFVANVWVRTDMVVAG